MAQTETQAFSVKIFSPFETFYEGAATSLSANSATGPFDVLFDHANFISLLLPGDIILHTPYGLRSYPIQRGILKVHNNYALVFANV